jgi:hypothetical protein
MSSDKKRTNRFRTGVSGGCEARLYEFREKRLPPDDNYPLSNRITPRTERIAALTLDEALAYLRFAATDFDVDSVTCLGLIVMVSGSPVN